MARAVYPYLRPMSAEAAPVDNWRIMNILRAWLQLRPPKKKKKQKNKKIAVWRVWIDPLVAPSWCEISRRELPTKRKRQKYNLKFIHSHKRTNCKCGSKTTRYKIQIHSLAGQMQMCQLLQPDIYLVFMRLLDFQPKAGKIRQIVRRRLFGQLVSRIWHTIFWQSKGFFTFCRQAGEIARAMHWKLYIFFCN